MRRLFVLVMTVLAAGLVDGGQLNPKFVSKEAVWVAHLDLELINSARSGLCGWFVEQSYKPEAARGLAAAQAGLGLDLRTALKSITIYGLSGDETQAAALLDGAFDRENLLVRLTQADGYTVTTNSGCEIHSWYKHDNPVEHHYGAFFNTNIVAFASDEKTLVHAVKVLQGGETGGENSTLLSIAGGRYLFTAAFQSDEPLKWPQAGMLRNADAGALYLEESEGKVTVRMMLNVTGNEQAENLFKIAQGLKAMAQLNAADKPKAAEIARNIVVDRHERAVSLTLTSPSEEVVRMLEESVQVRAQAQNRQKEEEPRRERKPF